MQYTSANYPEVLTARQALLNARFTPALDTSDRMVAAVGCTMRSVEGPETGRRPCKENAPAPQSKLI